MELQTEQGELDALDLLGASLRGKVDEQISQRSEIEARWVDDMLRWMGHNERDVESAVQNSKRSKVVVNLIRSKTNAGESQLIDLLFPNNTDKNYSIGPTPVPELEERAEDNTPVQVNGEQFQNEDGQPIQEKDLARREIEVARERAAKMSKEVEDQLVECNYSAKARMAIHYGAVYGTGILKGPVVVGKTKKSWQRQGNVHQIQIKDDFRPTVEAVKPWDFFPDMAASELDEAEFIFERRYMTRKQVRDLVKRKGFMPERVRKVLMMQGRETQHHSDQVNILRQLNGLGASVSDNRFEVWEYHGPIPKEALISAGAKVSEDDPLEEYDGIVWFCGSVTLKVMLNPMPAEQWPYSIWCWEPDDTCIFGFGVPHIGRSAQRIINTSWRMMLDNASVSTGPQIGINKRWVEPQDGSWDIKPWKIWQVKEAGRSVSDAISTFEFNNHQGELSNIYSLARTFLDEETGLPMLAQGQQGTASPTMGGMSMLMNSANTVRRRQVKDFDDNITVPLIERFYDWNMQFNPKPEIKGDMCVKALGSSSLLVKETQAQNLMLVAQNFAGHPSFAPLTKMAALYRALLQSMHIDVEDIVPSDAEIQQMQEQQAQQQDDGGAADKQAELQLKYKIHQEESQLKLQLAQMEMQRVLQNQKLEIMRMASMEKISASKAATELKKLESEIRVDLHKFNTEAQLKQSSPPDGNYGLE